MSPGYVLTEASQQKTTYAASRTGTCEISDFSHEREGAYVVRNSCGPRRKTYAHTVFTLCPILPRYRCTTLYSHTKKGRASHMNARVVTKEKKDKKRREEKLTW